MRNFASTCHRAARGIYAGAALAIVLGGCGGGDSKPTAHHEQSKRTSARAKRSATSPPKAKPIQTRTLTVHPPLRVDVLSLGRVSNNMVKLRLRLTNTGTDQLMLDGMFPETQPNEADYHDSLGGIMLVDGTALKQYYPRLTTDGHCVCTNYPGAFIDGGTVFESTILYPAPPPQVKQIDIAAQRMPPFTDVPISSTAPNYPGDPDPATAALRPPLVTALVSTSEDLGGDKSIDDKGASVDIRLSSDVLFKLNKATLTGNALASLKDVASRLDKAKATTAKVDGYTDTSGNDAINIPLSKRRARSVETALKRLVTRSGISFETAGHGSKDPVASNESAKGRKENRRVTVSFTK